jgi:hypothetical protein
MAQGKKSFLLYCDYIHTIEKLTDQQAGKLFKHILQYVNDQDPQLDDLLLDIAFEPIKQQLKRDLKKYEGIVQRNTDNGKKGGRPKGGKKIYSSFGEPVPLQPKEHFLYLIYDNHNNQFKIGETKDLMERRRTIKRPTSELEVHHFIQIPRYKAIKAETEFIRIFKEYRLTGDWFVLNEDNLNKAVGFMNTQISQSDNCNPKKADNDTDTDTDTDNDTVSDIDTVKEKKKRVVDKSTAIHKILIADFSTYYEKQNGSKYHFSGAKDGSAVKSLIKKIKEQWKFTHAVDPIEAEIRKSFNWLIEQTKKDQWLNDRLSLSIVNSKFNEIINLGKKKNGAGKQNSSLTEEQKRYLVSRRDL